jgi:hypothetical protein
MAATLQQRRQIPPLVCRDQEAVWLHDIKQIVCEDLYHISFIAVVQGDLHASLSAAWLTCATIAPADHEGWSVLDG